MKKSILIVALFIGILMQGCFAYREPGRGEHHDEGHHGGDHHDDHGDRH